MQRILYSTLIIFLFQCLSSCGDTKSGTEAAISAPEHLEEDTAIVVTAAQFEGEKMELGRLSEQDFATFVSVTGMIDIPPQNQAMISAFSGGYLKHTPLLIGDAVKKGQALLTLENPEFIKIQQEYLETVEQLVYLKTEYERQSTLLAEKITSEKNFLKAESDYKRNLAVYNGLRQQLKMLNISPENVEKGNIATEAVIFSPISGNVTRVHISTGQYVSPSEIIMEIINTDHVHVELSVFEKNIMDLKKDQKIRFKIPEVSDTYYEAEIYLVGTSLDQSTRTVKVHGHLHDEKEHNFAVGMFVEADIITDNKPHLALPVEAVIAWDNKNYVLTLEKEENGQKTFSTHEVQVGPEYQGYVPILDPGTITVNDQVLVKGGFLLIGEAGGHDH